MTPILSPNTQAILLLTAPLIVGRGTASSDLLTPSEYKRFARHLRDIQRQPADLVLPTANELVRACSAVIDESRLQRLLGRGFLLSQVIEQWQSRAIWVVSRADSTYPWRLKARLREDSPAVLYGCGDITLLESGGLAVVGSRHVDDSLIEYAMAVGGLAAKAGRTLVSGGARGIDQAAMRGALAANGRAIGVLADSLEKTAMNRENRNFLLAEQLVLISPYDPSAGFNVGHAMQRNKLIYALADSSLVVSSDLNKGGTWAGAVEQLDKFRFIPVYVRSTGQLSPGLDALLSKGATHWPEPQDVDMFEAVFDVTTPTATEAKQQDLSSPPSGRSSDTDAPSEAIQDPIRESSVSSERVQPTLSLMTLVPSQEPSAQHNVEAPVSAIDSADQNETTPAEILFSAVRHTLHDLLRSPMKDVEIAAALDVSNTQAKTWLQRLVEEGILEKQKKSSCYVSIPKRLF